MDDPGLPESVVADVERCFMTERPSGTLIVGLKGGPFRYESLEAAVEARFPDLSARQREEVVRMVDSHVAALRREERRREREARRAERRWYDRY